MSTGNPHLKIDWKPSQHGHLLTSWWATEEVRTLPHAVKNCLRALFQLLRKEKNAPVWEGYQSHSQVAALAGASRRSAIRAAKLLCERGLLAKRQRWRDFGDQGANRYRLLAPPSLRSVEDHAAVEELLQTWQEAERGERCRLVAAEDRRQQKTIPEPESSPAVDLVRDFHRRIHGRAAYRPFAREVEQAQQVLDLGDRAGAIYDRAMAALKNWKPEMFGGLMRYVAEAAEYFRLEDAAEEAERVARIEEEAQRRRWEAERPAREAREARERAERERIEAQRRQEREAREAAAAAAAAREAMALLPGLVGRLAEIEQQFGNLPPVVDRTPEGKPLPAFRVAAKKGDRGFFADWLSGARSLVGRIEAGAGNIGDVAQLESGLDRAPAWLSRLA